MTKETNLHLKAGYCLNDCIQFFLFKGLKNHIPFQKLYLILCHI